MRSLPVPILLYFPLFWLPLLPRAPPEAPERRRTKHRPDVKKEYRKTEQERIHP
jgi:hypothetical protein